MVTKNLPYDLNTQVYSVKQMKSDLKHVQKPNNSPARAATRTVKYEHITPKVKTLNWLPTKQRIQFKTCYLNHKALHSNSHTSLQPSKLHCFSLYNYTNVPALHITYFRSTVGKFACSAAGPRLWNFLLTQECCKFSRMFLNHLRLHLKIHLFSFECLLSQNRHFTPKCGGMNL